MAAQLMSGRRMTAFVSTAGSAVEAFSQILLQCRLIDRQSAEHFRDPVDAEPEPRSAHGHPGPG